MKEDEKTETLNLVYELEMYEDNEDELTTEAESDIGEETDKAEYSAFVPILSVIPESQFVEKRVDQVEEKLEHLSEEYAAAVKHLFQSYPDIIAYSYDDVRPFKCKTTPRLELAPDEPIL